MRKLKYFLYLLPLILSYAAFAQIKNNLPVPPNGIWIRDSLFMDKTEITNISWLEYLYYLKRDSSQQIYEKAIPDTTVWLSFEDTLRVKRYLHYPAYREFPVTGITYEQAVSYCQWRSQAVNARTSTPEGRKGIKINEDQKAVFFFRLPTENEWIAAASGLLDSKKYPYGYTAYGASPRFKEKDHYYYNKTKKTVAYEVFKKDLKIYRKSNDEPSFNTINAFKDYFEYGDYAPRSVKDKRSIPNSIGVYDMMGNVAEMVAVKGIAKGGSWAHDLEGSKINRIQLYNKAEAWLGFRCICEVSVRKR